MPPTAIYEEMLRETPPEVIETEEQYEATLRRFNALLRKGRKRSPEETKFLRLLDLLVSDYDRRHALPELKEPPAARLQYLLEVSGKSAAELLPIFGQKSHVSEALKGKRPISAEQARKLGKLFRLQPGYFI